MSKLNEQAPTWGKEKVVERLMSCWMLLHLHGFITDAERDRIYERIKKAWGRESDPCK